MDTRSLLKFVGKLPHKSLLILSDKFYHVAPDRVKGSTDEDFQRIFQHDAFFQTLLKNFLGVTRTWSKYLKVPFDLVLYNREKIRSVRHTNPILSKEISDSCVFSTSKIWHPNQTRKFYENLHFLLETFFSNASKIFFMSPTRMFKVSKRCVLPSSLRRKKNENHPTHRSKYFWKKLTPPKTGFGKGLTDSMNL